MQTKLVLSTIIFSVSLQAYSANCKITYFSQKLFEKRVDSIPEIRDLSKTVNNILKKSYSTLDKIDEATLGLVSAISTGGIPLNRLKPEQWDKINISGNLIYQDMPFSGTALKGVKMIFSENNHSRTITTGSYGEFAESFSKLVPFERLHLFPIPFIYTGQTSVPTMKIPINVKIESHVCNAETTIQEVPLEPLVFILSKIE